MKQCPKCGSQYPDDLKFCKVDGTPLVDVTPVADQTSAPVARQTVGAPPAGKICPRCGARYDDSMKFCKADGTPLIDAAAAVQTTGTPVAQQAPQTTQAPRPQRQATTQAPRPQRQTAAQAALRTGVGATAKKKSAAPAIVLAVLLVVLLAGGAVFGMHYFGVLPFDLPFDLPTRAGADDDREEAEFGEADAGEDEEASVDEAASATEEAVAEEVQDAEADDELPWKSAYLAAMEAQGGTYDRYGLCDFDGDGIPAVICYAADGSGDVQILQWNGENAATLLETEGGVLVYYAGADTILHTRADGSGASDKVYALGENGVTTETFDGGCKLNASIPFDSEGAPIFDYTVGGRPVDEADYFAALHTACYDQNATDLASLPMLDADALSEFLREDWKNAYSVRAAERGMDAVTVDFAETAQFFTAPRTGNYRFTLYGANGGTDNFRDYDAEGGGASLTGTVQLDAGQRVVIVTGGKGDCAVSQAGTVVGGFNGGGDSYWSGAGGGCTDLYLEGVRIAAAAGSGGGNYESDQHGKPGRTSKESGRNVTDSKFGSGDGRTDGGGGGGGWLGGTQGKPDQAGYGGVNGWDSRYFKMEKEFTGSAYTETGSFDGSARIEMVRGG